MSLRKLCRNIMCLCCLFSMSLLCGYVGHQLVMTGCVACTVALDNRGVPQGSVRGPI